MPSSVRVGVRPMMASTRSYSSALRPKLRARDSLTGVCMRSCSGSSERVEQRLAVGAAHQRIDQVLGVRHQAEDAQIGAENAGDGAGAAVEIDLWRHVAGLGGVAEGDQALSFQAVERVLIGEIVAVAVRHDGAEGLARLVLVGEDGVSALDPQVA